MSVNLRERSLGDLIDENDVQSSWNSFKQTLTNVINRHAPFDREESKGP